MVRGPGQCRIYICHINLAYCGISGGEYNLLEVVLNQQKINLTLNIISNNDNFTFITFDANQLSKERIR
jgi:hypothetical protein